MIVKYLKPALSPVMLPLQEFMSVTIDEYN